MKAVIYGAGNIGRGFIGQLFYESGYDITFIDIDTELIDNLNAAKKYPIKFVDGDMREIWIENVSGISGGNIIDIMDAIAEADIMATSVGVNAMPNIFEPIALSINRRFEKGNFSPLNIIICENAIDADKTMSDGIYTFIDEKFKVLYKNNIGFVASSVGRTVPNATDETKGDNPLRKVADSYKFLPVNKSAFCGEIPTITGMIPYTPFSYYIERKLYIHNMGHAVCAYLGDILGYSYIWQAAEDEFIIKMTRQTMQQSAKALSKKYNANIDELFSYVDELLHIFANKALGDTVTRVGNDLTRKLSPNDRLVGAFRLCKEHGVDTADIVFAIAAATKFKHDKLSGQPASEIISAAGSTDVLKSEMETIENLCRNWS